MVKTSPKGDWAMSTRARVNGPARRGSKKAAGTEGSTYIDESVVPILATPPRRGPHRPIHRFGSHTIPRDYSLSADKLLQAIMADADVLGITTNIERGELG